MKRFPPGFGRKWFSNCIWLLILGLPIPLRSLPARIESHSRVDTAGQAMVVAAHPLAVQAGIGILRLGGNAVDAAIATSFVLSVVEPYASGLGGGGGMLIFLKTDHSFHYLDHYMQAPQKVDTAFSRDRDIFTPRAICVPGTPSGLITALKMYGRLDLKTVMTPALKIARQGIVVDQLLKDVISEKRDVLYKYQETRQIFLIDGHPPNIGDTLRNPGLHYVLQRLAEDGLEYFYRGEFALRAKAAIQSNGGYLTLDDFASYSTLIKSPVHSQFRQFTIYSSPPPQAGTTLLEILNILEHVPHTRWKEFAQSPFSIHLMCEAIKRADADRYRFLGDPRFFQVPTGGLLKEGFALQRYRDIDTARVKYASNRDIQAGNPLRFHPRKEDHYPEPPHTTHISVIDEDGNAVSLTQTIGLLFGSGFSVGGVLFNSSMSVFTRRASPNRIAPLRRPASTISPSIIMKNGKIYAVLGTPGGRHIFNILAEVIVRLIDFGMNPVKAVDSPLFSARLVSDKITMEGRFSTPVIQALERRGHKIKLTKDYDFDLGGVTLIFWDSELQRYIGVSDPRRGGAAKGY